MRVLTFLARRFVAGDTLDEALVQVRRLNVQGLKATLDFLGEETHSAAQARAAADEYERMLERIAALALDCNVSLKLTQFGLGLGGAVARENLERVLKTAKRLGNFVRLDMEGSAYTQRTLDIFYHLHHDYPEMGVVIQAMLRRSEADVAELVRRRARVRLCKGAYKEPPELAFQAREEINANYDLLAAKLAVVPWPAYATHDDDRIAAAKAATAAAGVPKDAFEFQMLYGLRSRRWRELRDQGHQVRVYVPYGTQWLPYFVRRLRERKENVLFVLRGLFQ